MIVSGASFYERSRERIQAAPYGEERDQVSRQVLRELGQEPGMEQYARAGRAWGMERDDYSLRKFLTELEQGERDLKKLASVATPLLADESVKRAQLGSLGCELEAELWDVTTSKQLRDTIYHEGLMDLDPTPLATAWALKTDMKFSSLADKEAIAGVIFKACERHPEQRWVNRCLEKWEKPLNWATLEKACDVWSEGDPARLAQLVTDRKDHATQRRQLSGLSLALFDAVAEPKKAQVWSYSLRKPDGFLKDYMGYHYSAGAEENEKVYQAVWPHVQGTPAGELMQRWGLTNLEALKSACTQPEPPDKWHFALSCTPAQNAAAMRSQLAELDTPMGRLGSQLAAVLGPDQVRRVWERCLRSQDTPEEKVKNELTLTLNQVGVPPGQSLEVVKLLWREHERTAEQIPVVQSFRNIARGPGLDYVLDRLLARPVLSESLRADLAELRRQGASWDQLRPLLERMKADSVEEDGLRKLAGKNSEPSSGIKDGGDAIEVGGVRLPKRRASSP